MPFYLFFFALATIAVMLLLALTGEKKVVKERVRALSEEAVCSPREVLLQRSFAERVIFPGVKVLAKAGARLTPVQQRKKIQLKLRQAGLKANTMQAILAAKGLGLFFGLCLGWLFLAVNPRLALMAGGFGALLGFRGPDKWLEFKIAKRREAIVRALPDTLDLVTAGTEAGLSFDAAVQRIVARPGNAGGALKEELARYLADIGLGQARSDALADLAYRCGEDDMKSIVAALLQADQLGVGVGSVLRSQTLGLRTRRRQRAQETAMKAPVKMLFPLVFFIFPALFVVIMGPAALQIMDQFLKR